MSCSPPPPGTPGTITDYAMGTTYSPAVFHYLLTVWVTRGHCPFAIVEDEPLEQILRMLNSKVNIPSATTLSCDVKEVFVISKQAVLAYLKSQKSAIHVVFDGWTVPHVISYLGVVVCWEEGGQIRSLLLDYVR